MTIKHLILDANVLLLLVVGNAGPDIISRHKRLRAFREEDYRLLLKQTRKAESILTSPNVMTEVGNLLDHGFRSPWKDRLLLSFRWMINEAEERFEPSATTAKDVAMPRLGLTDTGLLLSLKPDTVLLTIDGPLFREAIARNLNAVNFHHLREDEGLA